MTQGTPNPARTSTSIGFSLPSRQAVRLTLVNILGDVRATIIDGPVEAGQHNVQLDATTLEPGVYWYRLETGGEVLSRQMVIIR